MSLWAVDHTRLWNLPPWAIAALYAFSSGGLFCLLAAAREHFIRYGINLAERSALLKPPPPPDTKEIARERRKREHEERTSAARSLLTKEDFSILRLLTGEQKTEYSVLELARAATCSRDLCAHHLDRLIEANYVDTVPAIDGYGMPLSYSAYKLTSDGRAALARLGVL